MGANINRRFDAQYLCGQLLKEHVVQVYFRCNR
jgi:hypothetical protein